MHRSHGIARWGWLFLLSRLAQCMTVRECSTLRAPYLAGVFPCTVSMQVHLGSAAHAHEVPHFRAAPAARAMHSKHKQKTRLHYDNRTTGTTMSMSQHQHQQRRLLRVRWPRGPGDGRPRPIAAVQSYHKQKIQLQMRLCVTKKQVL